MVRGFCAGLLALLIVNVAQAAERGPAPALLKAGEKGLVAAQVLLGSQYLLGINAQQNLEKAHIWYGRAAGQGDPKAQTVLGLLHLDGAGVKADAAKAAAWFQLAAIQGSGEAQLSLGALYAQGNGVTQDRVESHMWLTLAIATLPSGDSLDEAIRLRSLLAEKMSQEELHEANRRARGVRAFAVNQ